MAQTATNTTKKTEARAEAHAPLMEAAAGATRTKILEAAFRQLGQRGYAALSVREIAKDAGVNHALINYHFRTKDQLVIEVLDAANQRLLERQRRMYDTPGGFAEKWAQARRFYQDDLASGFVRVQAELWAASFSNPELREKFLPRIEAWRSVVLGGVREALEALEAAGTKLPAPFAADAIACFVSDFWLGMEFTNLLGSSPEQGEHRKALDAMQHLLESVDRLLKKSSRGEPRDGKRFSAKRRKP